jgi:hypothetical protein
MGWNTAALLVCGRSAEQSLDLLEGAGRFRPTGEWVTADVASSHELGERRLAISDDQPWCWLWDPYQRYVPYTYDLTTVDAAAPVLAGTAALAVMFSSVSTIYGFWLYHDGRLVRRAVHQDGAPVDMTGEPLESEASLGTQEWFSGDAVWTVLSAVTGLTYYQPQRFQIYAEG